MNESGIIGLLALRHKDDIFVPKCRTGGIGYSEFDAWAMEKAWTNPRIVGYEVKVSRPDFAADNKWQNYLPFCNELYFVTPYKMVEPVEVPGKCGLIWASQQATRVYIKKKSDYWPVQPDKIVQLFKYLILSRMEMITHEKRDLSEYWKRWLERKDSLSNMGHLISRKLHEQFEAEIRSCREEVMSLRSQLHAFQDTAEVLRRHGIDMTARRPQVYQAVCKLVQEDPNGIQEKIDSCMLSLQALSEHLRKIKDSSK